jgi:MoaA/NifB/PqqE/SkfB family radical SAM enzyme
MMVCEKTVEKNYTEQDLELMSHLIQTPEEALKNMRTSDYCMQFKQVTIDAEGSVFLCQLLYEDRFKLMKFLDVPLKEIQHTIRTHSFCGKCMKAGGNVLQECYSDFSKNNDPVKEANKKRHYNSPIPEELLH